MRINRNTSKRINGPPQQSKHVAVRRHVCDIVGNVTPWPARPSIPNPVTKEKQNRVQARVAHHSDKSVRGSSLSFQISLISPTNPDSLPFFTICLIVVTNVQMQALRSSSVRLVMPFASYRNRGWQMRDRHSTTRNTVIFSGRNTSLGRG